jgi:phosphopantetheinyl transferase
MQVWLADRDALAEIAATIEHDLKLMPEDELIRASGLSDPAAADRWRAGRTILRLCLAANFGSSNARLPFGSTGRGAPRLANERAYFSISDSGSHLLIGVSRSGQIGVDIERRRIIDITARRADRLIAAAQGLANQPFDDRCPLSLRQAWTRLEAFSKATAPSLAACLSDLGTAGHVGHPPTPAAVWTQAVSVRVKAATHVYDLSLPHDLAGAVAGPAGRDVPGTAPITHHVSARTLHDWRVQTFP